MTEPVRESLTKLKDHLIAVRDSLTN
jgi:hypothetical protein